MNVNFIEAEKIKCYYEPASEKILQEFYLEENSMKKNWKRVGALAIAALLGVGSFAGNTSVYTVQAAPETTDATSITVVNTDVTTWKYLDDNTDPASGLESLTAWTEKGFDDSAWKTGIGAFGAKKGAIASIGDHTPDVLLKQYKEDGTDIETYFFRTTFEVENKEELTSITGDLLSDDASAVYINGVKVASLYMPSDEELAAKTSNMYYAGASAGDPVEVAVGVDAETIQSIVTEGENVLAVELHNDRASSSDIYMEFTDLTLNYNEEAKPVEQKSVTLTMGSNETERNLTWYANTEVVGEVQYALKSAMVNDEFPVNYNTAAAASAEANESGFYTNQATMTGLTANSEYVYRLVNGETVSDTYNFETGSNNDFTFALVGDPQIGAGSTASDIEGWDATLDVITNKLDPDFLLSAGDQVNTASNETQYTGYLNDVLASLTSATTVGNHDSGSAAYGQHFNLPNESTELGTTTAGGNYWFVYNNTLFMGINSNDRSLAEHKTFMESAIAANPDVTWKTVFFHHSIYSAASHWDDGDIIERRNEFPAVLDELDIDVVLMGHDHVYTRSYMMNVGTADSSEGVQSEVFNPSGILYLTANSASGSKYYELQDGAIDAGYAAKYDQSHRRTVTDVTVTDNSYTMTTYFADDMSQLDTFTIYKTDKAALETAIKEADTLMENEADYTAESWAAFKDAYDAACTVYADEKAKQETIDDACTVLENAAAALEKIKVDDDTNADGNTNLDNDTNVDDGTNVDGDTNVDDGTNVDGDTNVDDDANADEDDETSDTPKTGDTTNVAAMGFTMIAAAGAAVIAYKKRKETEA